MPDPTRADGGPADLLPSVKRAFNAKKLCMLYGPRKKTSFLTFNVGRKATSTIKAINRMATLAHVDPGAAQMREKLTQYKEESEKVCFLR